MIVSWPMRAAERSHRQKIQLNPAITMNKNLIVFGIVSGLSIFVVAAQENKEHNTPAKALRKRRLRPSTRF